MFTSSTWEYCAPDRTPRSTRRPSQAFADMIDFEPLEPRTLLCSCGLAASTTAITDDALPALSVAVDSSDTIPVDTDKQFIARIINGDRTSGWPAVGIVNDGCTGTLIAPNIVLTAAHCMEDYFGRVIGDTEGTFEVGGQVYRSARVIVHPNYSPRRFGTDRANDIAIMVLDIDVTGVTPMEIYRQTPTIGQVLTLVGFGEGGTPNGGGNGDFGIKRVGQTPIDNVTSTLIHWDFDDASESNTSFGDSGGPAFVRVDGDYFVAGVTSGGSNDDSSLGDEAYDTRVDAYAAWIDGIVAEFAEFDASAQVLQFASAGKAKFKGKETGSVTTFAPVFGTIGASTNLTLEINLRHKRASDLSVELLAPDLSVIDIIEWGSHTGKLKKTLVFDDAAGTALPWDVTKQTGTFQPDNPLDDLTGMSANGSWGLRVTDHVVGAGGRLRDWSLTVTTGPAMAASTTPIDATTIWNTDSEAATPKRRASVVSPLIDATAILRAI